MRSGFWRNTYGVSALLLGVALFVSGARVGTDPELAFAHRVIAASALTPAGVVLLASSYRSMRSQARTGGEPATREETPSKGA